ncbi:MAG: PDZ domain-containing protein [Planctomycetes bacterium]|nr:PDZ domain-containing protein [Planctomycetota bacterium]
MISIVRILLVSLTLLLGASCSLVTSPEPLPKGFYGLESATAPVPELAAWLGVEVAFNESDSLESLDLQPGVRLTEVEGGGPAAEVGLRIGDVLLSFDGTPTDDPERLDSLLRGVASERAVALEIQRGDQVFAVNPVVRLRSSDQLRGLYFVERALWRVALTEGGDFPYPKIHLLAEGSPLRQAGAREGDWIMSFQGRDPGSPAELIRRVRRELQPGEEFKLTVRREANGRVRELEGWAWMPRTVLNEIGLWPVFSWNVDRAENRETFEVGNLIILSLFKLRRVGSIKRWSILSLLTWETGTAMLQTVEVEG